MVSVDVKHHGYTYFKTRSDAGVHRRASAQFYFGQPFASKRLVVQLWLYCLVTLSLTINEAFKMALIVAYLNAGVILVVTI